MARGAIHKRDAKRYLRAAKVAAVGLALLAAAMWAIDIPGVNRVARETVTVVSPNVPQRQAVVLRPVSLDREASAGLAERLELATSHKPAEAAPAEKTGPSTPTPAAGGPEWKYFGPIYDGMSVRALVSVKGRQRVMREGQQAEGATLQQIAAELIVIKDSSGEHEIARMGSEGTRVSWVRGAGVGAVPGGGPGAGRPPGGAPGALTPPGGAARGAGTGDAQARSLDRLRKGRDRGNPGGPLAAGAPAAPGVGAPGAPTPAGADTLAGETTGDQTLDAFTSEQQKMLGAYPELGAIERKLRESGMSPDEIADTMAKEYESRGLPPPTKLTPEQQEIRDKLLHQQQNAGPGR